MKALVYAESKSFYGQLDAAVRDGAPVRINFGKKRLTKKSELWPRLMRCRNGDVVKKEFKNAQAGKPSALEQVLAPQTMTACLGGGAIWLIAFIATLIAGIIGYGIYKNRMVKFGLKTSPDGSLDGYIEVVPA